jgi:hypothetical protein
VSRLVSSPAWDLVGEQRAQGFSWDYIGRCNGMTGEAARKRYQRWVRSTAAFVETPPEPQPTGISFDLGKPAKVLLLPDTQVEVGVPLDHFKAAGRYAAAKEVDAIVHIGDFGNFDSLSTYETPLSREGLRLRDDINACHEALELLQAGLGGYDPELQFITLGNHEDRLDRYVAQHSELEGYLKLPDFERYGWTVFPFLQPVCVGGVYFCHYFTRTAKGWAGKNPHPNAQQMTRREMVSCIAGHTPGLDTYIHPAGGGAGLIRGTIAGSFYQHDEAYQGPQGNRYWRGCLLLTELEQGYYSLVEVSMRWLLERYGD